jgi:radical SAM protein with 4Fe4S-binding SPASM domain
MTLEMREATKTPTIPQNTRESDAVGDEDTYALSPVFRPGNEHDHIKLYGARDRGDYNLHHTTGIVLALCNGRRTVRDIAAAVVPFVDAPHDAAALKEALAIVKTVIAFFRKSEAEQRGEALTYRYLPSEAALVPIALLPRFGRLRPPEYDPRRFLPKYAYPGPEKRYPWKDRAPSRINWHLTSACAADCRYCYLKRREIPESRRTPWRRVLEIIQECREIGVFDIDISGGDVLLYPHLVEFLAALEEGGFPPVMMSTKAYCSEATARRLSEHVVASFGLQFSIDSTIPELADYLTRTPGFCERTLQSIDNALKAGLPVTTKTVVTPYNILTVPRLYPELRHRGVERVILASYCRSGYHHTEDLFNHAETYEWLEKEAEKLRQEFPDDFVNIQNGRPGIDPPSKQLLAEAWKNKTRCTAGRSGMMICADGKVIPCEQMPEVDENFCGDLKVQSVMEVWNSREFAERTTDLPREKFQRTPCYDCESFEHCVNHIGYCIRDTAQFYGTIYTTPPNCPKFNGTRLRTV